jgi:hypothetical protein
MLGDVQLLELLFGLHNPTNEKLFIDRYANLFETHESKTWIDVYQPRTTQLVPGEASAPKTSSESGPSGNAAAAHRIGEDIEYGSIRSMQSMVADLSPLSATLVAVPSLFIERLASTT